MWKFSYLFKNWHIEILHFLFYCVSVCVLCDFVAVFLLCCAHWSRNGGKFTLNRGLKRVWFFCVFCIFNSIRPSVVAVFLCCEYIVGLLGFLLLCVCDFLLINLRAARDECELNMLLEKMAFSYARKRVFPFKSGWDGFVNRVWKFVGRTFKNGRSFSFSLKRVVMIRSASGFSLRMNGGGWATDLSAVFFVLFLLFCYYGWSLSLKTTVILWRDFSFAV